MNVQFEGDFDAVHLTGDNRNVLPTDTMKNTVNALAKAWSGEQIEEFGLQLIEHFLGENSQVARVRNRDRAEPVVENGDVFVRARERREAHRERQRRAGQLDG